MTRPAENARSSRRKAIKCGVHHRVVAHCFGSNLISSMGARDTDAAKPSNVTHVLDGSHKIFGLRDEVARGIMCAQPVSYKIEMSHGFESRLRGQVQRSMNISG